MTDTPRTDALDKRAEETPDDVAEADYRALCRTLELELTEARGPRPTVCYQPCERHKGMTMTFRATSAAITATVCPGCNPPPEWIDPPTMLTVANPLPQRSNGQ